MPVRVTRTMRCTIGRQLAGRKKITSPTREGVIVRHDLMISGSRRVGFMLELHNSKEDG